MPIITLWHLELKIRSGLVLANWSTSKYFNTNYLNKITVHNKQNQWGMPENTEAFTVFTIFYTFTFSTKRLITVQKYVWAFQQPCCSWFLLTYTIFMSCSWEQSLFFQLISLHPSCSGPASSSVDWLCPQSTVDRAMVGSESILQDSGSIHTHTGLSGMPQNQDMTLVFFTHTCHVNI